MNINESKLYQILIALMVMVSIPALFGPVMEPDSALYASIAKTMVLRNDYLNLFVRGADWLDKPHLTFWIAAVSFKIFGISGFAYKLPSFLCGLWAAWYIYKMGKLLYQKKIALIASLIFLSSLHVLISTFDVRAEIYMATFSFGAIYYYYKAQKSSFGYLILGSFFVACAIMVKGIFVVIPIFGGFIVYWLLSGQAAQLLKIKWWLAIILVCLFILPELYTLYYQWDMHPEKLFFGKPNASGIKFFFWDSQFGRFFNSGPIKGSGDKFFFFHTIIWAFLPWSILFYAAVFNCLKKEKRKNIAPENLLIWASAAITFLLFSLSKFQLPHYIVIILPQFALLTAGYLYQLQEKGLKIFNIIQNGLSLVVSGLLIALAFYFNFELKYLASTGLLLFLLAAFQLFKLQNLKSLIGKTAAVGAALMLYLSLFFYPEILKYESGAVAAKWLNQQLPWARPAVLIYPDAYSFDFYAHGEVKYYWSFDELIKDKSAKNKILYLAATDLSHLKTLYKTEILQSFDYYHTTRLKPKFLNAKTRGQCLEKFYLVKIQ